jgi:D-beta-D-heptose 7-phosphate kinase/D-beta-D-heptose 1-phosphate adenosyltransferase
LVIDEDRPTTTKTRIIARSQQVVRFDRERRMPLQEETVAKVLAYLNGSSTQVDALIVSDYAKGMVTPVLMDGIRALRAETQLRVIVDPKVRHVDLYRGMTMVTPNHHEAARMSGIEIHDEETLDQAGRQLLRQLDCEMLLVTRGKEGMNLFLDDGQAVHIPTVARRVYDVTGAGDTVLAAVTLGMVAGLSPVESAVLANIAAGIVVGEVGTAAVSADQLLSAVENNT